MALPELLRVALVLRAQSSTFRFSAPKSTYAELAIVCVHGGVRVGGAGDDAKIKDLRAAEDSNVESLCGNTLTQLGIDQERWGAAVSTRPLLTVGGVKPFTVHVCTITGSDAEKAEALKAFRDPTGAYTHTIAMVVDVELLSNAKTGDGKTAKVQIEVGVVGAGDYRHFRAIGGSGHVVVTPSTKGGEVLGMEMAQFDHHFDYYDVEWQKACELAGIEHVKGTLTAGLAPEKAALVTIEKISVRTLTPLRTTLVRKQSVQGLELYLLVKGVAFRGEAGDDAVDARPIPLRANLPNGLIDATGTMPVYAVQGVRFRLAGAGGECNSYGGFWYSPGARLAKDKADAATAGKNPAGGFWASAKTNRRKEMRTIAKKQQAADRRGRRVGWGETDGGDTSDDSTREVRAAVSRAAVAPRAAAAHATVSSASADATGMDTSAAGNSLC